MFPLSQPKVRLEQCSLRQRMLLEKKCAVSSVPNFWVGDYAPFSWAPQMCASQSCPLTMPLAGGLQGRFGGFNLTPFYR